MEIHIYKIVNLINGKIYIGQTKNTLKQRFSGHKSADTRVGRAIRYHGAENFVITEIATARTQEQADELERKYIKEYDAIRYGYNIEEGGILCHGRSNETNIEIGFKVKGNSFIYRF